MKSTVVESQGRTDFRERSPSGKLKGNEKASCPYCGRQGKAHRIEEHKLECHKRPVDPQS